MSDAAMAIAITEAKIAVERVPDATVEDRFRAASRATYRHWVLTDPDKQFMAACEALYGWRTRLNAIGSSQNWKRCGICRR